MRLEKGVAWGREEEEGSRGRGRGKKEVGRE